MDQIIVILLVIACIKLVVFGFILFVVFRRDVARWWDSRRAPAPTTPPCMYCGSLWTGAEDEGSTRWEDGELILVTTYRCQHCELPFWHVERVPVASLKS